MIKLIEYSCSILLTEHESKVRLLSHHEPIDQLSEVLIWLLGHMPHSVEEKVIIFNLGHMQPSNRWPYCHVHPLNDLACFNSSNAPLLLYEVNLLVCQVHMLTDWLLFRQLFTLDSLSLHLLKDLLEAINSFLAPIRHVEHQILVVLHCKCRIRVLCDFLHFDPLTDLFCSEAWPCDLDLPSESFDYDDP